MAGDDLIETYVDELALRLRWRVDGADVVDELRDHLLSACEAGHTAGRSFTDAQRDAIERAGEVDVVAEALLTAPGVRLAMPTRFTRVGGAAGLVAAVAWPLVAVGWSASVAVERHTDRFEGTPQGLYVVGAGALWVAAIATVIAVVAICRRQAARGWFGRAAVAFAAAGAAATSLSWFVLAWAGLLAVAGVAVLVSSPPTVALPRWGLAVFAAAWPAAAITWVALRWSHIGWRDHWGGYPLAHAGAITVGAVLVAVACAGLGRRLISEDPVTDLTAS